MSPECSASVRDAVVERVMSPECSASVRDAVVERVMKDRNDRIHTVQEATGCTRAEAIERLGLEPITLASSA